MKSLSVELACLLGIQNKIQAVCSPFEPIGLGRQCLFLMVNTYLDIECVVIARCFWQTGIQK